MRSMTSAVLQRTFRLLQHSYFPSYLFLPIPLYLPSFFTTFIEQSPCSSITITPPLLMIQHKRKFTNLVMNSEDHLPLPINIPNDNYPNCHDYTPLYLNNDAPIHSNEGYEKTATNSSKKSSHVKFHDIICTIYIPCKDDFITCGVYDHLWWKPKDFKQFKIDALTEICLTMKEMNFNHAKDAIQYLYQPNEYPQANNFVEQSTLSLTASTTCSLNSNSPNMIIYSS